MNTMYRCKIFFILLFTCAISGSAVQVQENDIKNHASLKELLDDMSAIKQEYSKEIKVLQDDIQLQNKNIYTLQCRIDNQEDIIHKQEGKILEQEIKNIEQRNMIEEQRSMMLNWETVFNLASEQQHVSEHGAVPGLYVSTGFGCTTEIVKLECPFNQNISIISAFYGQYHKICTGGCCPPNPLDCVESVEENAPIDWAALTSLCNDTRLCEFQNPGRSVPSCDFPYASHYLLVYYACQPENKSAAVAFAAYADATRDYNMDDIVIFDNAITNLGNNYHPITSQFVCPFSGVYSFSATTFSDSDNSMVGVLMRETEGIATTYGFINGHAVQGSVTATIECERGERIWVKGAWDSMRMYGNTYEMYSVFTGFLIQAY